MTAPRAASVRFPLEPRDIDAAKAARLLGLTEARFADLRDELFARGFPRPDVTTGNYDRKAIEVWQDRRSGLTTASPLAQAPSQIRDRLERWDGGARRKA